MATRPKTDDKRDNLKATLRARCSNGAFEPGRPIPGVREMAEEFGLSKAVTSEVLRDLVEEGLLYAVPRVGIFVERAPRRGDEFYLLATLQEHVVDAATLSVITGFENAVARHGGVPLVMSAGNILKHHADGDLPPLSGALDMAFVPGEFQWPAALRAIVASRVRFHVGGGDPFGYDEVSFDDFDGGRQATRHLIEQGHRRIAFLGLHANPQSARLIWSQEREEGWRDALCEAGIEYSNLAWHPQRDVDLGEDETQVARDLAQREVLAKRLEREEISAVVAVNDHAAAGLMNALRDAEIAPHQWPAIVGFDGDPAVGRKLLTSLRLPWEEIGRAAADILWERASSSPQMPLQHRRVAMKLIPRLTTRRNWSTDSGHVALAAGAV